MTHKEYLIFNLHNHGVCVTGQFNTVIRAICEIDSSTSQHTKDDIAAQMKELVFEDDETAKQYLYLLFLIN